MKTTIKESERKIISALISESDCPDIELPEENKEVEIEYSGVGYFLTFKNTEFPKERYVLDKPNLSGSFGDIYVGFVAFVMESEFTLECYSYGEEFTQEDRERKYQADST
jgi:hypothetical protein